MKPAFYTQHAPHQRKDLSHWGNYRSAITECNRSSVLMVKRKKEHHKKKKKKLKRRNHRELQMKFSTTPLHASFSSALNYFFLNE